MHIVKYVYMCLYVCVHMYMCMSVCACVYVHMCIFINMCISVCACTCHACMLFSVGNVLCLLCELQGTVFRCEFSPFNHVLR